MKTTSTKALSAAITTLIMMLLGIFGYGDMPPPESVAEALTLVAVTFAASGGVGGITWLVSNKPKSRGLQSSLLATALLALLLLSACTSLAEVREDLGDLRAIDETGAP